MTLSEYIDSLKANPNFDRISCVENVEKHPDSAKVLVEDASGLLWLDDQKDGQGNILDPAGKILRPTLAQMLRAHEGVEWLRVHFYEINNDTGLSIRRNNDIYCFDRGQDTETVREKDKPLRTNILPEPAPDDQWREDAAVFIAGKLAEGTIMAYEETSYNKIMGFATGRAFFNRKDGSVQEKRCVVFRNNNGHIDYRMIV